MALARDWPRGTQLIDGAVVLSEPAPLHQHVVTEFLVALRQWTKGSTGRVDTGGRRVVVHRTDGVCERRAEDDVLSPQMPDLRALVGDLIPAL